MCHVVCSHGHFQFNCGGTTASPEIHVEARSAPELVDPRTSFVYRSTSAAVQELSTDTKGRNDCRPPATIVSGANSTMGDWGEYDSQSHMYARSYYHSQTCLPLTHSQLDNDSDDEIDHSWIIETEEKLLDEFDDVDPHEKLFMKMWNRHVRKYKIYVRDDYSLLCLILFSPFD